MTAPQSHRSKSIMLFALSSLAAVTYAPGYDPYGDTRGVQGTRYGLYSGGTNMLLNPHNWHDWRKSADFETLHVDDDLTVEEMRYICQIPNLRDLELGKSPEVMKLRPFVLQELVNAKALEVLSLNVELSGAANLKDFPKLPNLVSLWLLAGPEWNSPPPPGEKTPALGDAFGFRIAECANLEGIVICSDFEFTDAVLERLAKCRKLNYLNVRSSKFSDESLRIIATTMKLEFLDISLPSTGGLSLNGLRDSTIRRLAIGDINGFAHLNLRAYESLLTMRNWKRFQESNIGHLISLMRSKKRHSSSNAFEKITRGTPRGSRCRRKRHESLLQSGLTWQLSTRDGLISKKRCLLAFAESPAICRRMGR